MYFRSLPTLKSGRLRLWTSPCEDYTWSHLRILPSSSPSSHHLCIVDSTEIFRSSGRTMRFALQRGANIVPIGVYRLKGLRAGIGKRYESLVPRHVNSSPGCLEGSPLSHPRWSIVESRACDCRRARITRVSPLSCTRNVRRSVTM